MRRPDTIFCAGLDLHNEFKNFNFSFRWDPAMRERPTEEDLLKMVSKGRQGDTHALGEFADAMFFTLRQAAFDVYQRFYGPFGIYYEEWFDAKLFQFLGILLFETLHVISPRGESLSSTEFPVEKEAIITSYDGEVIQPDEIESSFGPEDNDPGTWWELAKAVSKKANNRLPAAQEWLRAYRKGSKSRSSSRGWGKNQPRDAIIRRCLRRHVDRAEICRELDKLGVPVIKALQARGINKWADGWDNRQGRKSIQKFVFQEMIFAEKPCQATWVSKKFRNC